MIVIAKRKSFLLILFMVMLCSTFVINQEKSVPVFSKNSTKKIVLDAGHGFPDGGAIGTSGTIESTLNLKIALFTEKELKKRGYTVIMTRSDEESLSSNGRTLAERKRNDMIKRLDIINNSNADMFVSIHINKFTDSRYRGAQVIYSDNYEESSSLAGSIQKQLCLITDNMTKRTESRTSGKIFLLKNALIPAVIVECGFLSNFAEEQLLLTEKYQKELSLAIANGIENYYKDLKEH